MFPAPSAITSRTVSEKLSGVSPGSPAIRSMLNASCGNLFTIATASRTSAAVWRRPIVSSTSSDIVCGFTLTRFTPCETSTASFSSVTVSGRPASTVNSRQAERSKHAFVSASSRSSSGAVSVVGVPPPTYTAAMRRPAAFTAAAAARISCPSASR